MTVKDRILKIATEMLGAIHAPMLKVSMAKTYMGRWREELIMLTPDLRPEIPIVAAVRTAEGNIFMGHRHHHALAVAAAVNVSGAAFTCDQGFVTSHNRFVGREEAMTLWLSAGRFIHRDGSPTILFSEDLY